MLAMHVSERWMMYCFLRSEIVFKVRKGLTEALVEGVPLPALAQNG